MSDCPSRLSLPRRASTSPDIDLQQSRVDRLMKGESYIQDVPGSEVAELVKAGRLDATTDFAVVRDLDTINICVPTPLRKTKDPDMSYIVSASDEIAKYFHPGLLVILESTTYPGTTDELLLPTFEKDGLKVGVDFFLCFSPERVDPGNPVYQTLNTPKVVGGITPACTEMGRVVLLAGASEGSARQQHARGRDGETSGEYLPHDQHRPGERNGLDV